MIVELRPSVSSDGDSCAPLAASQGLHCSFAPGSSGHGPVRFCLIGCLWVVDRLLSVWAQQRSPRVWLGRAAGDGPLGRERGGSPVQVQQFPPLTDPVSAVDQLAGLSAEQFRGLVRHPDGLLEVLPWLCRRVVRSLPAVQGAGVVVQFRGGPLPLAWTAPWVRVLDEYQCRDRDGPGLRALHTRQVVACGRAEVRAGWPVLAGAVDDARVRAVRAEPLPVHAELVGVLTLYSTTRTVIDPPPERLTPIRDLLVAALTGYCAAHPDEDPAIRLGRELHNRRLLGRAIRVLMARQQVSEDLARRMLTAQTADGQVEKTSI